jgi:hypothetical protein
MLLVCIVAVIMITRAFLENEIAATKLGVLPSSVVAVAEIGEPSFAAQTIEVSDPPPYVDKFLGWRANSFAASHECGADRQDAGRPKITVWNRRRPPIETQLIT